jgi:WG containing repeat
MLRGKFSSSGGIMKVIFLLMAIFMLTLPLNAQQSSTTPSKLFPISLKDKHGYIDGSGKTVIPPDFDDAWNFSEGLAPVLIEDKWGYIDQTGKIVIPPQFFEVMPFKEGLALVGAFFKSGPINSQVGNYGYIDKTGKFAIAAQFGVAFDFSDGLARIQTEDYKDGYIDKTGKVVFWDKRLTEDFSDGLALFKTNSNMPGSKTGYLDKAGNTAISPKFDWGESFSEGLACVSLDKKAGFIGTKGNVAIDFRFDSCRSFSEGLAAVKIGDKWGYIDKSGKIVVDPKFAEAEPFSDDVAVVRAVEDSQASKKEERHIEGPNIISIKAGKFGVVDRNGRMILPTQFVQVGNFSAGLAWVNLGQDYIVHGDTHKWGYINKAGKFVWKSFVDDNRQPDASGRGAGTAR